ncbi:hypothetical protein AJ80_02555 [Polytolypa hystricis UAMH7299]|uniref:Uncharacterized protein n=1 Tax=Polytolypa hystricis (strain UAMH7299) TaxID=1447883 RepID=A0A2B7YQ75_POLH7|nr:hypothetical protein AJ80_02555 [Polytolypa hystricis UAMH7299]
MSTTEYTYSHRSRRSALIPPGVVLSSEEEALITQRIGYRPIPPPTTLSSNWTTQGISSTVSTPSENRTQHSELPPEPADAAGDELKDLRGRFQAHHLGGSAGQSKPQVNSTTVTTRAPELFKNTSGTIPQQRQWSANRRRQPSWKIDIPHMSEIQTLQTRSPATSTSSMSANSETTSPWIRQDTRTLPRAQTKYGSIPVGEISPRGTREAFVWS